jgi:MYXO-CTERM domain-containing protein
MRPFGWLAMQDLLLAQAVPGFLLSVGWTVMYEVYHEEGSFYTTLLQEILGSEGFFLYFVISALLMAVPVGMVLDAIRQALAERALRWPCREPGGCRPLPSPLSWMQQVDPAAAAAEERFSLYRHAWSVLFVPAKAAGNLALVLAIFLVWFVAKVVHTSAWHVFSWTFILGVPLVGLGTLWALRRRHAAGLDEFHRLTTEAIFPQTTPPPFSASAGTVPDADQAPHTS